MIDTLIHTHNQINCKFGSPIFLNVLLQGGDAEVNLKQSVEEIKKLNEEISAARQDNLQLKV